VFINADSDGHTTKCLYACQDAVINTVQIMCNDTSKATKKNIRNEFTHTHTHTHRYHHKTLQKYVEYKHHIQINNHKPT